MSQLLAPFLNFVLFIQSIFCKPGNMISNRLELMLRVTDDVNFDQLDIILNDFNLVYQRYWPFKINSISLF